MSTVEALLPGITTYSKAISGLIVANDFLSRASEASGGLDGYFEQDAFEASQSTISQQRAYIAKVLDEMPPDDGPIDARTLGRVTTSLKQTETTLHLITQLAADDKGILQQFLDALAQVVQGVSDQLLGSTWKVWIPVALVVGVLVFLELRK